VLATIIKFLLTLAKTQVIREIAVLGLKEVAKSTDNKIDNILVDQILDPIVQSSGNAMDEKMKKTIMLALQSKEKLG